MYEELYEAWKQELENVKLGRLSSDFYSKIADYLRKLKEEGRMLDRRTVKASLLRKELENVKKMVRDLVETRYKKLFEKAARGEKISSDFLTMEEKKVHSNLQPLTEAYQDFAQKVLRGRAPKMNVEQRRGKAVLRFLKEVPAIIGADMKTYGPFKVEDVASLPVGNSKILVKRGLAERIGV